MTKLFHPKQELRYFRCPTIEDGKNTLQSNIQEHPKLPVIDTGTNNLTPTSQIGDFVSEISAFCHGGFHQVPLEQNNIFHLIRRFDLPLNTISKINEQLVNQLSNLHNVHVVSHDNIFSTGLDVLHDVKHFKERHIRLFAVNLVEAIRCRASPPFQTLVPPADFRLNFRRHTRITAPVKNFGRGGHHTTQLPQQNQPSTSFLSSSHKLAVSC